MQDLKKIIERLTFQQLQSILKSKLLMTDELCALVSIHHLHSDCFTVDRYSRDETVTSVDVQQAKVSLRDLLEVSYKPQQIEPGFTTPRRIIGSVVLPSRVQKDVERLVERINRRSLVIKRTMAYLFEEKNQRRQMYRVLSPSTITSTIYRNVTIAPTGTYLSTFAWCNSQKSLQPIKKTDALALVRSSNKGDDQFGIEERIKKDEINVSSFQGRLYRFLDIRVHPTQQLTYRVGGERKRKTIKAASPILTFVTELSSFKQKPPYGYSPNEETRYYTPDGYKEISAHHRIVGL